MARVRAAAVLEFLLIITVMTRVARAQAWNDPRTRALIERATALRALQLADTTLSDYRAEAHGYVTFLAQVGEGYPEPPKIVKADELALEVYWRAPNLSKQVIEGRRDTLLLPTDIQYHRDHLGIVQNNFPNVIRIGEGDEVRDVVHPLSAAGLADYDYAITDSLREQIPGRIINLYEVKVRPKDDRRPGLIGALFIDRDDAQVVRMAFSFTRASLLDKSLEDLSVVLENRLVNGRYWLPSRQEIEIRRTGTWMDFPARGIIRGRWEISSYQINTGLPRSLFSGPEIVQLPPELQRQHVWASRQLLDSMPPDVVAATDADVQRVQAEARALVRARALQRAQTVTLSSRRVSDFVRYDRVEGLAVGTGAAQQFGAGFFVNGLARYGTASHLPLWDAGIGHETGSGLRVRLFDRDWFREAGDIQERSTVFNSIAAQEFGSDYSDPYRVRAGGIELDLEPLLGAHYRAVLDQEIQDPLLTHATPVQGHFAPALPAASLLADRLELEADRPPAGGWLGTQLQALLRSSLEGVRSARLPVFPATPGGNGYAPLDSASLVGRVSFELDVSRPWGANRLLTRTLGVGVLASRGIPVQDLAYFGGPVSGPGYPFHALSAPFGLSQRIEWQTPIPFPSLSLGRFGRSPATASLAPFANVVLVTPAPGAVLTRSGLLSSDMDAGAFPSVGVGLSSLFDLLRIDVARSLRAVPHGPPAGWVVSIDASRELWSIL